MNATGLNLLMVLALSLGIILMGPTSCTPVFDELDSPSIIKDGGGLAAFAYTRKKQPQKEAGRRLMMPPTKNLTYHQRIMWADNCVPLGMLCKYPEQCCTKVCLVATRRCAIF
ncbi:uncharacterized protein LOC111073278 [Drosophila obscura]|uniref:uncharacterized protein LOC111073278 n=1 Tax=Drosophila obscura TaxID=7282 RepID=UPI001BB1465C|nr:uncharacterized protein LOC111073278 [Drosophila obscura]